MKSLPSLRGKHETFPAGTPSLTLNDIPLMVQVLYTKVHWVFLLFTAFKFTVYCCNLPNHALVLPSVIIAKAKGEGRMFCLQAFTPIRS